MKRRTPLNFFSSKWLLTVLARQLETEAVGQSDGPTYRCWHAKMILTRAKSTQTGVRSYESKSEIGSLIRGPKLWDPYKTYSIFDTQNETANLAPFKSTISSLNLIWPFQIQRWVLFQYMKPWTCPIWSIYFWNFKSKLTTYSVLDQKIRWGVFLPKGPSTKHISQYAPDDPRRRTIQQRSGQAAVRWFFDDAGCGWACE